MAEQDKENNEEKKRDEARRSAKEEAEEREKQEILARSNQVKGEQLFVGEEGTIERENELRQFALSNMEDPEKKYDVYYKGVQKLLKSYLPKGKQNKTARNYIYEEKNTYLTRGKRINRAGIRGADGRMGYVVDAEEILKIIMDWIITNGSMVDLYNQLRKLNKSKGYGTRQF